MITATEWSLSEGKPQLRAELVEREITAFYAAGGRVLRALPGERPSAAAGLAVGQRLAANAAARGRAADLRE